MKIIKNKTKEIIIVSLYRNANELAVKKIFPNTDDHFTKCIELKNQWENSNPNNICKIQVT